MITLEQKQAWREEYLEEMRKISQEIYPLEGREESDGEDFDERIILFYNDVLIPMLNTTGYVFQNFPIVVSQIDEKHIPLREEDALSLPDVFDYLCSISQYGRDIVLSAFPDYEPLLRAVQENDKDRFLRLIDERSLDFSEICQRIGYTSKLLLTLHHALTLSMMKIMEIAIDAEEESSLMAELDYWVKRFQDSLGEEELGKFSVNEQFVKLVALCSSLDIQSLDYYSQFLYAGVIPIWLSQSGMVSSHFMDEELAIIQTMMTNTDYDDIIEDIKRIVYIIYGFPGGYLYSIKNTEDLDTMKANLQLN